MYAMTDIQKARLEFYKNHPEAIYRTLPPRVVAVCYRCNNEIALDHPSLFSWTQTRQYTSDQFAKFASCPHCGCTPQRFINAEGLPLKRLVNWIAHDMYRIVRHVLKAAKRNWLGRVVEPEDYIDEIEHIRRNGSRDNPPAGYKLDR